MPVSGPSQVSAVNPTDVASTEAFLEKCEHLDYPERVKFLIDVGKQAGGGTRLSNSSAHVIQSLSQGRLYDRRLALFTAFSSGDMNLALQTLSDPSHRLRCKACKLVARSAEDDAILAVISKDGLSKDVLMLLIKALFKQRRTALVESILTKCKATHPEVYEKCFSFGGQAFVEHELSGEGFEKPSCSQFLRLCRVHPKTACRRLINLKSETFNDYYIVKIFSQSLPIIFRARISDDIILKILKNSLDLMDFSSIWSGAQLFLKRMPEEIVQLFLDHGQGIWSVPYTFRKILDKFSVERLFEIDRSEAFISRDFQYFAPDVRVKLYKKAWGSWADNDGFISTFYLASLPTKQRVREAKRQLAVPAISTRPRDIMKYAGLLSFDEAFPIISEYMRSKDVDVRASAVPAQLATVKYDRSALTKALDLVMKRKNEADPVRRTMIEELSKLPTKAFNKPEHLQALEVIFQDAFSATDLSHTTQNRIEQTILSLFNEHPAWAVGQWMWYAKKSDYNLNCQQNFDKKTSFSQLHRLEELVKPLVQDCMARKNYAKLMSLATTLREHFWKELTPSLLTALQEVTITSESWQAQEALHLLRDQPSIRNQGSKRNMHVLQNEMMVRLLTKDKTWIKSVPVSDFVRRRKQTLLQPFLVEFNDTGTWNVDGATEVINLGSKSFFRWTQIQQDTYALTLKRLILESGNQAYSLMRHVRLLGHLHYSETSYNTLLELIKHEDKVIRDTAVQTLSHLDEGKGENELIECLGDDRARVAIYAFTRILNKLSKDDALDILLKIDTKQVTVLKELFRLIAGLRTEEALAVLLEKEQNTKMHMDVRIALLLSLWHWVDRPEVFDVYLRNLQDPRKEVPIAIIQVPLHDDGTLRTNYLIEILAWALEHGPRDVGYAALVRCDNTTLNDDEARLAPLLAHWAKTSLLSNDIQKASGALFRYYLNIRPEIANSVIKHSLADKWRLQKQINALNGVALNADSYRKGALMVIKTLESDLLCFFQTIQVTFRVLVGQELIAKILDWIPSLHWGVFNVVTGRMGSLRSIVSEVELVSFEQTLRNHADSRGRRLGLALLLDLASGKDGWTAQLREHLTVYRADTSLMVAEAAAWVFPPEEGKESGSEDQEMTEYTEGKREKGNGDEDLIDYSDEDMVD
jgi:cellulose synthase operon protein C